jgi:hypothetical protein
MEKASKVKAAAAQPRSSTLNPFLPEGARGLSVK